MINKEMTKKELGKFIEYIYKKSGKRETVVFLDNLEQLGFKYATKSGASISMADMHIPSKKPELIRNAELEVIEVQKQYADGLITHGERYNKVIDIWANVTEKVADEMMKELGAEDGKSFSEEDLKERRSFNSIFMMADSGARGSTAQIRQLAGMRGLMAKPSGEIIESPITANSARGRRGTSSPHGARKGLADTR
jgi:DNA-directed RNA polymerase subunit beta'